MRKLFLIPLLWTSYASGAIISNIELQGSAGDIHEIQLNGHDESLSVVKIWLSGPATFDLLSIHRPDGSSVLSWNIGNPYSSTKEKQYIPFLNESPPYLYLADDLMTFIFDPTGFQLTLNVRQSTNEPITIDRIKTQTGFFVPEGNGVLLAIVFLISVGYAVERGLRK